jgi:hypothetical protein
MSLIQWNQQLTNAGTILSRYIGERHDLVPSVVKLNGVEMDNLTKHDLFQAARTMKRFGGSFASCIAEAYLVADSNNAKRLLEAFSDLFAKYHAWNMENN